MFIFSHFALAVGEGRVGRGYFCYIIWFLYALPPIQYYRKEANKSHNFLTQD